MPYATGETPMIGDRIKDKQGQQAKVNQLEGDKIMIQWDEGVLALEYPPDDFFLVARAKKS